MITYRRLRSSQNKVGRRRSNSNDFISQMPDEVLVMILSLLPIKDALITSILATRWRFLCYSLGQLNFDGTKTLDKIAKDPKICESERAKYVNQVDRIIQNHTHQLTVKDFRICFDLDCRYDNYIHKWVIFAVNKKVEILELDLTVYDYTVRDPAERYNLPYLLWDTNISDLLVVAMPFLKQLYLKSVNVRQVVLQKLLSNSPNLETLSIHCSDYLTSVCIGGRALKLKHLEIASCNKLTSVLLCGFDLESFTYLGHSIALELIDLPNLKEIDMGQGLTGLDAEVFRQISSCASSLEVLSFDIYSPQKHFTIDPTFDYRKRSKQSKEEPDSIFVLANVKKLTLTIGARQDDCLLSYTYILNACPRMETCTIKLNWISPRKIRKRVASVAKHSHNHLKNLEILGYYGRVSDLELVAHIIKNATELTKIVVDPCYQGSETEKDFMKIEQDARSCAKRQIVPIVPKGVELVIL